MGGCRRPPRLSPRIPNLPTRSSSACRAASTPRSRPCCCSDAGYAVQGLFMSNWEDEDDAYCTTAGDFQDARRVCETLGIPLHRVSFAAEYREKVFNLFPARICRRAAPRIRTFSAIAKSSSASVSTTCTGWGPPGSPPATMPGCVAVRRRPATAEGRGHAPRTRATFCTVLPRLRSARRCFRSASCARRRCGKLAHAAGLPVYDKPDSTGICFIGERPFQEFLEPLSSHRARDRSRPTRVWCSASIAASPCTPWVNDPASGIGRARGRSRRTVVCGRQGYATQRPDRRAGSGPSAVVVRCLRCGTNALAECARNGTAGSNAAVKTRYRQNDLDCALRPAGAHWRVTLRLPARAVTPGQYAVFYSGEQCLGGGIIARRFNSRMARRRRRNHL